MQYSQNNLQFVGQSDVLGDKLKIFFIVKRQ